MSYYCPHRYLPATLLLIVPLTLLWAPAGAQAQGPTPVVSGIDPATITAGSATPVTVTGTNLTPFTQVILFVNHVRWTIRVQNTTGGTATFIPPTYLGPGTYPVGVRTEHGVSNTLSLTVTPTTPAPSPSLAPVPLPPPESSPATIINITPPSIPAGSSTPVTITGTGFTPSTLVYLITRGSYWSMSITRRAADSLTFVPPSYLSPGRHPIVVRTQRGDSNAVTLEVVAIPLPTPSSPPPPIIPFPPVPLPSPPPHFTLSYTALGDSLAQGFFSLKGYVAHFRDYVAQAFNATVHVTNLGREGWTTQDLRFALQRDATWRQAVLQADVVTWNIGGNDLRHARRAYQQARCGGADNQDCLRHTAAQLKANWSGIVAEVVALSVGKSKTVRTMDLYNPFVGEDRHLDSWPLDGGQTDFQIFKVYLDDINAYIARTTTGNGIAYAPVYQAFNGPLGTDDPAAQGYISFVDDFHPNTEGHRVIGDLLRHITPVSTLPPIVVKSSTAPAL
ncbi:MAG: GDSL-type esterase/lipase family protein [Candidatus Andersenbacteria bacterium]